MKNFLFSIVVLFFILLPFTKVNSDQPQQNVEKLFKINADEIEFDYANGIIIGKQNVNVNFSNIEFKFFGIKADLNQKKFCSSSVSSIDKGKLHLSGDEFSYNYKEKQGSLKNIKGSYENINISGEEVLITSDFYLFQNINASTCPENKKDYRVFIKKVELAENKSAKMERVSIFLHNLKIFKWKKYEMNFEKGETRMSSGLFMPQINYSREAGLGAGFFITKELKNYNLNITQAYFTKYGFLPQVSIRRNFSNNELSLNYGKDVRKDYERRHLMIGALPSIRYIAKDIKFGDFRFSVELESGKIKEYKPLKEGKFNRLLIDSDEKVIELKNTLEMNLDCNLNLSKVFNGKSYSVFEGIVGFSKYFNNNSNINLKFKDYIYKGDSFFRFNRIDTNEKFILDIRFPFRKKYSFKISNDYDLAEKKFDEVEMEIKRTFNCLQWSFVWRFKSKEFAIDADILGF